MGRAFKLRDLGRLDDALATCRQAIELAAPVSNDDADPNLSTLVNGALTIDEIATRLGRPHLAREPLANALLALKAFNQRHGAKVPDLFRRDERRLRSRLEELRSLS